MSLRKINYAIQEESFESQKKAGRHNSALELSYQVHGYPEQTVTLSCGNRDDVDIRREGSFVYVLSVNYGLGYIGLECFDGDGLLIDSAFFQEWEADECLGKNAIDLTAANLIRRILKSMP